MVLGTGTCTHPTLSPACRNIRSVCLFATPARQSPGTELYPRTHPSHLFRSRLVAGALYPRGRPPMRGPGGAPPGRYQPVRGGERAETGGGYGAGEAAGGGSGVGGGRGRGAGGGASLGSAEGPVCGRVCWGERRGRPGQPSSLGVADRSQGPGGRY